MKKWKSIYFGSDIIKNFQHSYQCRTCYKWLADKTSRKNICNQKANTSIDVSQIEIEIKTRIVYIIEFYFSVFFIKLFHRHFFLQEMWLKYKESLKCWKVSKMLFVSLTTVLSILAGNYRETVKIQSFTRKDIWNDSCFCLSSSLRKKTRGIPHFYERGEFEKTLFSIILTAIQYPYGKSD